MKRSPIIRTKRPLSPATRERIISAIAAHGIEGIMREHHVSRDLLLDARQPGAVFLPATAARIEALAAQLS